MTKKLLKEVRDIEAYLSSDTATERGEKAADLRLSEIYNELNGTLCRCISYNQPRPYQNVGEVILDQKKYFPDTQKPTVCVDACIAKEIEALWAAGIRTAHCCCGHNGRPWMDVGILHPKDVEKACELLGGIDKRLWHVWAFSQ